MQFVFGNLTDVEFELVKTVLTGIEYPEGDDDVCLNLNDSIGDFKTYLKVQKNIDVRNKEFLETILKKMPDNFDGDVVFRK